jgi:hypothetical protein
VNKNPTNPFTFGDLALDDAFTDREDEIRELVSDMRNGQNVLVYAPRRYGKSSLVLRAAQEAMRRKVLVGYCDLMMTPTKERLAGALAKTLYSDIASPVGQAFERAAELFRSLRVRPSIEVDPSDGSLRFSFQVGRRRADIDDTIERLLELVGELAADRKRRVVIVFDEFQEIIALDKRFPNLMRAVFQAQPEVGHVYLGSKRHLLERIFNDRNEPFWRSAKQLEIGPISPAAFAPFLRDRFVATGKGITDEGLDLLLELTAGHPYGTQELAYFVWELLPAGGEASGALYGPSTTTSRSSGTTRLVPSGWYCWLSPTSPPPASTRPPTTSATSCRRRRLCRPPWPAWSGRRSSGAGKSASTGSSNRFSPSGFSASRARRS